MHTCEHLRQLFIYNDWANRRLITTLEEQDCPRAREILVHLLITQQEYLERLDGKDSTGLNFWPALSIEECSELSDRTSERYSEILTSNDESSLDRIAGYKTSAGVAYQNTFREILTHVLIHSSIHRGNIILKLRESGIDPPKIDYIIFLREKSTPVD